MLPDLWRMADRSVRAARGEVASDLARVADVLAGVTHHERADRVFHSCSAFEDGERRLGEALLAIDAPRLALFAHIAWEICLDGALVRRDGQPLLADIRAATLEAARRDDDVSALDLAARAHHAARKTQPLPERFTPRMDRLLAEVAKGDWIAGYARGPFVADRIQGIRSGFDFPPLTRAQHAALGALFDETIGGAGEALDEVLRLAP
jgi:hypothetical protein